VLPDPVGLSGMEYQSDAPSNQCVGVSLVFSGFMLLSIRSAFHQLYLLPKWQTRQAACGWNFQLN
jgi:hypothetical protein